MQLKKRKYRPTQYKKSVYYFVDVGLHTFSPHSDYHVLNKFKSLEDDVDYDSLLKELEAVKLKLAMFQASPKMNSGRRGKKKKKRDFYFYDNQVVNYPVEENLESVGEIVSEACEQGKEDE